MSKEKIIAYKGFDKDFKCRKFQYEVGKEYIHRGEIKMCNSGFHACINPFDVFDYYDVTSRFSIVELSDLSYEKSEDSKVCSKKIKIVKELQLSDYVNACFNNLYADASKNNAESGDFSKLAASGNFSNLAASGYSSNLAASGDSSVVMSAGLKSMAKVGKNGAIALTWVDSNKRQRISVGYEGENGIIADTWYTLDNNGNFITCCELL